MSGVIKGYPQDNSSPTEAAVVTVSPQSTRNKVPLDTAIVVATEGESSIASAVSMSSDFLSSNIDVTGLKSGSLEARWSGADQDDGTFVVECSNDGTNFSQYGESGTSLGGDLTDTQIWNILEFTTRFIRLRYTANSVTTGTFSVHFSGRTT